MLKMMKKKKKERVRTLLLRRGILAEKLINKYIVINTIYN